MGVFKDLKNLRQRAGDVEGTPSGNDSFRTMSQVLDDLNLPATRDTQSREATEAAATTAVPGGPA